LTAPDRLDIHHYGRVLANAMLVLDDDREVLPANRKTIKEFLEYAQAEGLSAPRQVRYTIVLRKLSKLLGKPFRRAGKVDLVRVVSIIEKEKSSPETKRSEKECVKKFYKWLRDSGEEYPSEVKWIRASVKRSDKALPENFLNEDEVKKLAEACQNPRDRALVLTLYETGARVAEILSLRIGDVQFDQYGAILMVRGKTGARRVRVIFSAKAITEWLNHHPARGKDQQAPFWTSFESASSVRPLEYPAFRKMLNSAAARTGINKRVNPHSFRHARASNLANALTEAQMKEYLGWVGDSKMAATYVHLSGRNIDNALLRLNGIKTEDEVNAEEHPLKAQSCARCAEVNPPTNRFCSKCGAPLDVKTAIELQDEQEKTDEIMNVLLEDPQFREAVANTLRRKEIANQLVGPKQYSD
jgi:integrase/recombinase XerD